jgi:galactonate dehydratase
VEAHLHETVAPKVIGQDPLQIDRLAADLVGYLGFRSTGAESRGNSAFDLALWDIFGKATGQPVAQLLGGFTRDSIRTYNTCAGPDYIRKATGQQSANFGLGQSDLDDLTGFLTRADELALSLMDEGITAMKIWPFDTAAEATRGQHISRKTSGARWNPSRRSAAPWAMRMDIMVEFHSLWQLLPAIRIARALAPYGTYWHEDPIRMDSLGDLRRYAEASPAPICASETLAGRAAFRDLLETGAAGIVMLDVAWCGGLSEARKIAAMAEAWHLPVAPHDCTGPVVLDRLDASVAERAKRADPGVRARLLSRLVSRCRHRPAPGRARLHHRAVRTRARPRAPARSRTGLDRGATPDDGGRSLDPSGPGQ